jgi:hypothetical protein
MGLAGCESEGTIPATANISVETSRLYAGLSGSVRFTGRQIVLHRGGSYQEYAKNINCGAFPVRTAVRDINDLMDESFARRGVDSIEIDLRTVRGNAAFPGVYVVHDAIESAHLDNPSSTAAREYLSRNSIDRVIRHFIEAGYYKKGKGLFIELKIPRRSLFSNNGPLDTEERAYVSKTLEAVDGAINTAIPSAKERAEVRRRITFISFNLFALEEIQNLMGDAYNLHFLAATNRGFAGRIAAARDYELNFFNDALADRIAGAEWLKGIWFDPRGMDDCARIFNGINERRAHPFDVCIFVYGLSPDDLVKRMDSYVYTDRQGHRRVLEHVKTLMLEIRKFPDPDTKASCD